MHMAEWSRALVAETWMPLVLAALVLAWTALRGTGLGLHHILTGYLPGHVEFIAVALTQIHYGEGWNYTGNLAVHEALSDAGLHPNLLETAISRNGPAMNRALAAAADLPLDKVLKAPRRFLQFDLGYVDFARLAFRVFGIRIEALYYGYFALLATSMAAFAVAFLDRPAHLWLLPALAISLYVALFRTSILSDINMETVHDWRFMSTLVVVPGAHLVLLGLAGTPPGVLQAALALIQAWFLVFVMRVRYAGTWMFVPVLLAGLWAIRSGPMGPWACGLLILVKVASDWRFSRRLHPIYRTPEAVTKYPRWHSVYLGFALDPETWGPNRLPGNEEGCKDGNAIRRVHHHFREHPEEVPAGGIAPAFPWKTCIMQIDIKWGLYESTIRRLAIDYLRRNAWSLPRLYLWLKPRHHYRLLGGILRCALVRKVSLQDLPVLLAAGAAIWGWALALQAGGAGPLTAALGLLAAGSAIPQIWAYSIHHGLADQTWIHLTGLLMLLALTCLFLVS